MFSLVCVQTYYFMCVHGSDHDTIIGSLLSNEMVLAVLLVTRDVEVEVEADGNGNFTDEEEAAILIQVEAKAEAAVLNLMEVEAAISIFVEAKAEAAIYIAASAFASAFKQVYSQFSSLIHSGVIS